MKNSTIKTLYALHLDGKMMTIFILNNYVFCFIYFYQTMRNQTEDIMLLHPSILRHTAPEIEIQTESLIILHLRKTVILQHLIPTSY